jgi:hypothetical protein
MVLRWLRTRCLDSRSRLTRTLATGTPSGAFAASTRTEPTGSSTSGMAWLTSEPAATLRKSTSTVSGSGWLVR